MNFKEDPYFSSYPSDLRLDVLLNRSENRNDSELLYFLNFSNVKITQHNNVKFTEMNSYANSPNQYSTLFETKKFKRLLLTNFSISDSILPMSKKYLLFKISNLLNRSTVSIINFLRSSIIRS